MDDLRAMGRALRADDWCDEAAIVEAIVTEIMHDRPACVADVHAEWREPYLLLSIVHADGSVLEVCDGDGYTTIAGGDVDFHGYLPAIDLIAVVRAAFRGRLTNVRHYRLGCKTADYFQFRDAEDLVGAGSQGITGLPGLVLRSLPFLEDSVQRTLLRFDRVPAFSAVTA